MADASIAANLGASNDKNFDAIIALRRARAGIELVRYKIEGDRLEEGLRSMARATGGAEFRLPQGFTWPGEVDTDDLIAALYGAFADISEALEAIDPSVG